MATHPRVSLHQVAFLDGTSTPEFIRICRDLGVRQMTLVTPLLMAPDGMAGVKEALAQTGVNVATVNHPFCHSTPLDRAGEADQAELMRAIELTADIGGRAVYLLSGGRGALAWEQAAARFAELVAPCRDAAEAKGVRLLIENAGAFSADFHIAHTVRDVTTLAETAGIGICLDFHSVWFEAGINELVRHAIPMTGLIQISDYVLGDKCAPCRAVPGDGIIPNERLIETSLAAGYGGVFDLELIGPRIRKEGPLEASRRSCEALSAMLDRLGA